MLDRIEVRGIGGKPFEVEPIGRMLSEPTGGTAMNAPPIPDQDDLAPEVAVHLREEPEDILGADVVRNELKVKAQLATYGVDRENRHGRQTVMPIPSILDRCLALRCPRSTADRLQHKAALIEKNHARLLSTPPFLFAATPSSASGTPSCGPTWRAIGARP